MGQVLIIVDFQNDFTPGGALAVPGGDEIASRVNVLAADPRFELIVASRDWHPSNHGSFAEHGGPWPRHCVQGTPGAELHPDLDRSRIDIVVDKGQDPATEGYSAFEATRLEQTLRDRGINTVTVVGLATDYCVKNTAWSALDLGFGVQIDTASVRGVDADDSRQALEELRAAGAVMHARALG